MDVVRRSGTFFLLSCCDQSAVFSGHPRVSAPVEHAQQDADNTGMETLPEGVVAIAPNAVDRAHSCRLLRVQYPMMS